MTSYLVLDVPVRRQRQTLVSKKAYRKMKRHRFNNLSLTEKNRIRKVRKDLKRAEEGSKPTLQV